MRKTAAFILLAAVALLAFSHGPGKNWLAAWLDRNPGRPIAIWEIADPSRDIATILDRAGLPKRAKGCVWSATTIGQGRRHDQEYLLAPFLYHAYPRSLVLSESADLAGCDFILARPAEQITVERLLANQPYHLLISNRYWLMYGREKQ